LGVAFGEMGTPESLSSPRRAFARFQDEILSGAPDLTPGLWADDVIVEVPFAGAGPGRWEGREAFGAYARAGRAALEVRFQAFEDVRFYDTNDADIAVVEYTLVGAASSRQVRVPIIVVFRADDGVITQWREYQPPLRGSAE
jgi:ketosteroid isomerase-like protein